VKKYVAAIVGCAICCTGHAECTSERALVVKKEAAVKK
jgi:hypothetical protein